MTNYIKELNVEEAFREIKEGAILIDIRNKEELEVFSFDILNVIHIPQNMIYDQLYKIPKDKTVIIGCNSGTRSYFMTQILSEMNFKNIYNLRGGILDWVEKGLPVLWDNYKKEVSNQHELKQQ